MNSIQIYKITKFKSSDLIIHGYSFISEINFNLFCASSRIYSSFISYSCSPYCSFNYDIGVFIIFIANPAISLFLNSSICKKETAWNIFKKYSSPLPIIFYTRAASASSSTSFKSWLDFKGNSILEGSLSLCICMNWFIASNASESTSPIGMISS